MSGPSLVSGLAERSDRSSSDRRLMEPQIITQLKVTRCTRDRAAVGGHAGGILPPMFLEVPSDSSCVLEIAELNI